ncbi:MAG: molybdate ABC transporter substrate-binding protein [Chromatiaceae bacterium]|nr:molybdate ABC transporter substrate-binding protein [Chromatiaceae bacterium]
MKPIKTTVFALTLAAATFAAQAERVQIAVAANFTAPMKEIAEAFAQDSGHEVEAAFGSSGKFYAQIQNGAPFEILLAADAQTPAKLAEEGLALAETAFTYAKGTLVLWSKDAERIQDGPETLRAGQFRKLAIANPRLAPYGAAAMETLEHFNLVETLEPRLVKGDNIAQTYQFAATGNAELGFVALSQVYRDGALVEGSAWTVPADFHGPIQQDAILLKRGSDNAAARALLDYLKGETAREIIRRFGYTI